MSQDVSGIINPPRFYQNAASRKNQSGSASLNSPFATQLLSTQSLFSSGSPGLTGSETLFETKMLNILNAISQHIRDNSARFEHYNQTASSQSTAESSQISLDSASSEAAALSPDQITDSSQRVENRVPVAVPGLPETNETTPLGNLSARFESGNRGIEAIGYDRVGGTSYGKYQISSRAGSMERFLPFLEGKAPDWAAQLKASGPADTGSTGGRMPETWRSIAAENPEKFAAIQNEFIRCDYYQPAREMVLEQTGLDFDQAPQALQEVLWSTAVQHGPSGAARIFTQASEKFTNQEGSVENPRNLIEEIFNIRSGKFSSSTAQVQTAVNNRFSHEKQLAFSMLGHSGNHWDT